MSLLQIAQQLSAATFPVELPISKKQVAFRPYTVGDEKILLAASAERENNPKFYITNTLKVIRNCISDKEGMLETLVAADVEYILMQIRAKSVGEKVNIKYTPEQEGESKPKPIEIELDLEKFYVFVDPEHEYTIKLSDEIGIKMRDLTFVEKIGYSVNKSVNKTDILFNMIVDCIESIYDGDSVYVIGQNATKAEASQFIEQLQNTSDKLYKFVATMPQIAVDVVDPNTEKTITLKGSEIDFLALSRAT